MAEPRNTDNPSAVVDHGPAQREQRISKRRQVSVCGVKGLFARKDAWWILENESELSVLVGLGANRENVTLLQAMVPVLSAGVAGPGDLDNLSRRLQSVAEADEVCWVYVPEDLMAAVTVACAHWDHEAAHQWLCWALTERLEENLSGPLGVEAGWLCWEALYDNRRAETWWRGTGWMKRLDREFWDRLANHENPLVRAANMASNPKTTSSQLESLAASGEEEILDLVASHPKAPAKVLLDLADLEKGRPVKLMWRAAQNLSAPKRVLERLASEALSRCEYSKDHTSQSALEMTMAQCLLAQNTNTPPRALTRLSRSEDAAVLSYVACNPNTPHQTMERPGVESGMGGPPSGRVEPGRAQIALGAPCFGPPPRGASRGRGQPGTRQKTAGRDGARPQLQSEGSSRGQPIPATKALRSAGRRSRWEGALGNRVQRRDTP